MNKNNADLEYFKLLTLVLDRGRTKKNRTEEDTLGVFGAQARFDLSQGFPLLTTKKVSFHNILHELLWFLSGSTNIKYLVNNNVNIWNADCYKKYVECNKINGRFEDDRWMRDNGNGTCSMYTIEEFTQKIKSDDAFATRWANLGDGAYGQMWRAFPYSNKEEFEQQLNSPFVGDFVMPYIPFEKTVDQISKLIDGLKNNPDSRRHIVTAWHPKLVETVVLPPCHCLFQFHTEELTESERQEEGINNLQKYGLPHVDDPYEYFAAYDHDELDGCGIPRRRLNCQLYQRSCDLGLGFCYNLASYALLTHMVAQVVGMIPGEFIWTGGDVHIYKNHIKPLKEQMSREPFPLPFLYLNPKIKDIFDFKFEDIKIENYQSHPFIKMELSV